MHIQELIADGILIKKPGYGAAIERLLVRLRELHGEAGLDFETLRAIYPLHPATLTLLEEVRDRFSKARGVVDFTVTQLRGNVGRRVTPFLDRPWGIWSRPMPSSITFATCSPRLPGSAKGKLVIIAEDDEHLDDFKEYML